MAEDYALTSVAEIGKLKKELEDLRKNPLAGTASGRGLMDSLESVSDSLGNMMELFKEASEQMKLEEREEQILAKKIGPLLDKLDSIEDQNKKIAQGIVAVADMIEEMSSTLNAHLEKGKGGDVLKFEKKPEMAPPEPMAPISPEPSMPKPMPLGGTPPPSMMDKDEELGGLPPIAPPELPGQPMQPPTGAPIQPPGAPMPPPGPTAKPKKKGLLDLFTK